ncbi:FimV/HubP family polar landmark protein [Limnobacter sp. P1]|uniref:FimV/HubP family polar landmark protein n=2 Tax=Pseudomonadota TaxID=1224 RepID=UPI0023AFBE52|nr:FimV/HubP family polar landmark protein [Limnobacter sp. P1]
MRHTKKKILPFVFASGLLASSFAQAAQLGKLEVLSGAGEPFLAQIQVDLVLPEERASLQAKLASAEAFKAARLSMDPNLKSLQFAVQDGPQPGTALVKITSAQPLPAGFIDTLLELTWAGGRVAREYTLTVPVGGAQAAEPATSLPEIRPPMTPPAVAPKATAPKAPAVSEPPAASKAPAASAPTAPEGTLNVERGDTLSELALQLVGGGVTLNQAMAAIYEANKASFINGSVHLIREGAQIQVPNRAALRARNANEALLILAQNDDRNVYSAYARQIGLLTVDNQLAAADSTSAQGSITPQDQAPKANAGAPADRLQIAPGSAQGASNADTNAEELVAKNKALAEANERIALLEKNVSDLQRLLDMQKDLGSEPAAPTAVGPAVEADAITEPAAVEVPSETLAENGADEPAAEPPVASEPAGSDGSVQAPVEQAPAEEQPFDWLPWILAGAGGLIVLLVLLLIARARKNKTKNEEDELEAEDDSSFSEVNEFDEAIAAASAGIAAERASGLNRAENSDFDLDEVLNDRLKQADPDEATQLRAAPVEAEDKPAVADDIPELNDASEEALQQKESLHSEVTLDFPEEEPNESKSGSILDDLDEIEKGTLAAQEELDELRKQPLAQHDVNSSEIDAAFDDLIGDETTGEKAFDLKEGAEKASDEVLDAVPEEAFDKALVDLDVDVPNPKVDDATWQEVATKLDLAGAYVEIGDADGAKELLNEIVKKGDVDQVRKAKALLATLS